MRFKGPLLIPFLNIFVLTLRGTYSDIYQAFVWNNSAFTSMRNAAKTRSARQQYLPYYIKSFARQNGAHLRAMQIVLVTWAKQNHRVEVFFGNTKKLSNRCNY